MFDKPFNIHINKDKRIVQLAIRVSDNYVQDHIFDLQTFMRVTKEFYKGVKVIEFKNVHYYWQLYFKKNYVKMFYKLQDSNRSPNYHFRFNHEEIVMLFDEFKAKLEKQRSK